MSEERTKIEIWMDLTQSEAGDFLDRLANDEDFRELLTNNPRAALVEYRIEINDAGLPEKAVLPSPEEVRGLIQRIKPDEYGKPSAPTGYAFFMVVLPFGHPPPPPPPDDDADGDEEDKDGDDSQPDAAN